MQNRALEAIFAPAQAANSMPCREIPYATEQGIFAAITGNFWQGTGKNLGLSSDCRDPPLGRIKFSEATPTKINWMTFAIRRSPGIHGELLKLGVAVGQTSVAKYIARRRGPAFAGLEDVSAQSCGRHRCNGLFVFPTISWSFPAIVL